MIGRMKTSKRLGYVMADPEKSSAANVASTSHRMVGSVKRVLPKLSWVILQRQFSA